MFLSPIFASIPPYATGPAIIFVGALMFEHARLVEWHDVRQAVPAFLTIIMMPLTYSIAYGVIVGVFAAIMIWFADVVCDTFMSLVFKRRPMRQVGVGCWAVGAVGGKQSRHAMGAHWWRH